MYVCIYIYIYTHTHTYIYNIKTASVVLWLACWPLAPKFAGSNPAEAVKILSTPSSGGEVKESVPCASFAACKRTQ